MPLFILTQCQKTHGQLFPCDYIIVVEIMILHAIDKCISSKVKWIMALELTLAVSKKRKVDLNTMETIHVTLETYESEIKTQPMLDLGSSGRIFFLLHSRCLSAGPLGETE